MRTRLQRAEEKRDDLAEYLSRWAFGMRLSERRQYERQIAKAEAKVERLRSKRGAL